MDELNRTIYWDDEGQPISQHFDDIYFSKEDGLAETDYVFLQNNQLEQRFSHLQTGDIHTIGETGFGTGLNFLACCELWGKTAQPNTHLHFISTEKYPLTKKVITQAAALWPTLSFATESLLKVYPSNITQNTITQSGETVDMYRLSVSESITLTLLIGDAATGLEQLLARTLPSSTTSSTKSLEHDYHADSIQWQGIDTWFLDGFAPAKNPDMWTEKLFATMAKLSHNETHLATFTAAGNVRRGLSAAGFSLSKAPGFGKKREMLIGRFTTHKNNSQQEDEQNKSTNNTANKLNENPLLTVQSRKKETGIVHPLSTWALTKDYKPTKKADRVAVIGGGLAGCHSAYALANKGYQVTIFEKSDRLASGASGNAQGVVYGKLSAKCDPLGEINRYSLRYAQALYFRYWQQKQCANQGDACGVLQLSLSEKMQQAHQAITDNIINNPEYVRYLSAQEASTVANTRIDYPALYFPQLGWVNPALLCQWLTQHSNITITPNTHIDQLKKSINWVVKGKKSTTPFTDNFDLVVVANAYDAAQFEQTQHLPIKKIRGQVSHYPATEVSQHLRTIVCGKGYIAPATHHKSQTKIHCLGASFNLHNNSTQLNAQDHQQNIEHIQQQTPELLPEWGDESSQAAIDSLEGRVSFRCVTPDYLPITGAVPVIDAIKRRYGSLSKNGRQIINEAGDYHPGLYVNIGYGSRGLSYAPLCSEILASTIEGAPPPIPQYLIQKLNPARFVIRDLIRAKP
ncbi:FAD-dependent 5-carboxymethylaminomethyl-2-thiouridine(34) oxidoreductase MnmC [Eionea flava]